MYISNTLKSAVATQGDGINYTVLCEIQDAVLAEGFSSACVAYGMGGALLQKINRDTMSFATKVPAFNPCPKA
jgi:nicotinamide phosphoribosyltransferase